MNMKLKLKVDKLAKELEQLQLVVVLLMTELNKGGLSGLTVDETGLVTKETPHEKD